MFSAMHYKMASEFCFRGAKYFSKYWGCGYKLHSQFCHKSISIITAVGLLCDSSNSANKRVAKESPSSKKKLEVDVGDTPVNFYHSSSIEVFRNIPLFFPCSVYFLWEIFDQFCHSNSWEEMLDQPKSFQERNMRVVVTTYCKQNCHNKESQSELQGDPNQNPLFQMALSLNQSISDPMFVKSKLVWEAVVFCDKN